MIKKYLPATLLFSGIILLIIMMFTISGKEEQKIPLMHPTIIAEAVISILLMTVGIALLLKRL